MYDDITLFQYEIDYNATFESFQFFGNIFKNPDIPKSSFKNAINMIDAEFRSNKESEHYRIARLHQILDGKKFSDGNFESLGDDYKELIVLAKNLFNKNYKKRFLVIISNLCPNSIANSVTQHFLHRVDKLTNQERKCFYCENKVNPENNYRIKEIVRYKGITENKNVIISISLISENLLPYNIYSSLMFYLKKSDHTSIISELKKMKLIISRYVYNEMRSDKNALIFYFIVENTELFIDIYLLIADYIELSKKHQMLIYEQAKIERKNCWQHSEEQDPNNHIKFSVRKLLKSEILFTDLIHNHECTNLYFDDISIILVDREFNIPTKKDYYELYYEIMKLSKIEDKNGKKYIERKKKSSLRTNQLFQYEKNDINNSQNNKPGNKNEY